MIQDDDSYRQKLIDNGVKPEFVESASGYHLNCIGNLVRCYRDGLGMKIQDPVAYEIKQARDKKPIHAIIDVNMYEVVEFLATVHRTQDDFIEILASHLEPLVENRTPGETISILIRILPNTDIQRPE